MMQVLPPWSASIGKHVVRTPNVYIADTGLLHALLDIPERPKSLHIAIGDLGLKSLYYRV